MGVSDGDPEGSPEGFLADRKERQAGRRRAGGVRRRAAAGAGAPGRAAANEPSTEPARERVGRPGAR